MIGYMITKENYNNIKQINFKELRKKTDSIIVVYEYSFKEFRRVLFLLDSLNFNIGIYINEQELDLSKFISNIKGFNIKLGVWINNYMQNDLLIEYRMNNFITGIISEDESCMLYRFGYHGDIEIIDTYKFYNNSLWKLKINTDLSKIYDELKLKPIDSTYKK